MSGIIGKSYDFLDTQLHNAVIRSSVFAAIVYIVAAHPATFRLVDSVFNLKDKTALLLLHSVVVAVLMYFGSMYLFTPLLRVLFKDENLGKNGMNGMNGK